MNWVRGSRSTTSAQQRAAGTKPGSAWLKPSTLLRSAGPKNVCKTLDRRWLQLIDCYPDQRIAVLSGQDRRFGTCAPDCLVRYLPRPSRSSVEGFSYGKWRICLIFRGLLVWSCFIPITRNLIQPFQDILVSVVPLRPNLDSLWYVRKKMFLVYKGVAGDTWNLVHSFRIEQPRPIGTRWWIFVLRPRDCFRYMWSKPLCEMDYELSPFYYVPPASWLDYSWFHFGLLHNKK